MNIFPKTLDELYTDNVIEENLDFQGQNLYVLLYCEESRQFLFKMNHIERYFLWKDVECKIGNTVFQTQSD